ncbi:MAG: HAD-IA family hydrolase [Thermoplasmata archaeon]|nr:HAD-IA family hydrolase [Candidatus Sysuiplasma acidicola]
MSETLNRRFGTDYLRAFLILREEAVAFDEGRITVGEFCMRVLDRLELNIDAGEFISILDSSIIPDRKVWSVLEQARDAGGVKIVALSNMPEHTWTMLKTTYGMDRLFDGVVLSYVVGIVKPDSRIFDAAIKVSGTTAKDCLFVDDAPENVAAAERRGIVSHLFRNAEGLVAFLKNNGIILRS